jgi:hypothetical protein
LICPILIGGLQSQPVATTPSCRFIAFSAATSVSSRSYENAGSQMLSQLAQASLNIEQARDLRSHGSTYREIRRQLGITACQLAHIRRALKREKAAHTKLTRTKPRATVRDLPVRQSVLPPGLRQALISAGFRTLGDLSDRLADPCLPGLESISGIGPHRARLVTGLLDHFGLLPGPANLQAEVERLFPEFAPG